MERSFVSVVCRIADSGEELDFAEALLAESGEFIGDNDLVVVAEMSGCLVACGHCDINDGSYARVYFADADLPMHKIGRSLCEEMLRYVAHLSMPLDCVWSIGSDWYASLGFSLHRMVEGDDEWCFVRLPVEN